MTTVVQRVRAWLGWCPMAQGRMSVKRVAGPGAERIAERESPGDSAGGNTPYLAGALFIAIGLTMTLMIVSYSDNAWWFYALIFLGLGMERTLLYRVVQQCRRNGS